MRPWQHRVLDPEEKRLSKWPAPRYKLSCRLRKTLILLGSVTPLHVRVDVDENGTSRVRPAASASACLRESRLRFFYLLSNLNPRPSAIDYSPFIPVHPGPA
jgi:hypothetical protein